MGRYHFSLTLPDTTMVQGSIAVEAIEGGHGGLALGDWEVDSVAAFGEPVLAVSIGHDDRDAIAAWVAPRHGDLDAAITREVLSYLDPFEVAADTEAVVQLQQWMNDEADTELDRLGDEEADAELEEHFLNWRDAHRVGRLVQ